MSVIFILIPIAILLVILAAGVFIWAVKANQFEDLERHGYSVLLDDDRANAKRHSSATGAAGDTEPATADKQKVDSGSTGKQGKTKQGLKGD